MCEIQEQSITMKLEQFFFYLLTNVLNGSLLTLCKLETPKLVLLHSENPDVISSGSALFAKTRTIFRERNTIFFLKLHVAHSMKHPDITIKLYRKCYWPTKGESRTCKCGILLKYYY